MTAPNKNEGLIARLRDAGSTPFGHFAGEPEGTLALFHIADGLEAARAIQGLEADLSEALKHLKAMSHVVPRPFEVEAAHAFLERLASTADG